MAHPVLLFGAQNATGYRKPGDYQKNAPIRAYSMYGKQLPRLGATRVRATSQRVEDIEHTELPHLG